jgi:S-DNA-T family DNA segregation ATPase FtsK/SpoIIIE
MSRLADELMRDIEKEAELCGSKKKASLGGDESEGGVGGEGADPMLRSAIELAVESGKISTSLMQRNLGVGYGRAAKIIDQMEDLGYVSPPDGNKPRRVLITMQEFMEKVVNDDLADGGASAPSEETEE